ncbi:uncharacterized protein LOC116143950 [Pistacia vera]|uniref:uncharacterized protein LOC116143950 n=1 Tax=Pistacia vera TaxID=55513 RepID=UPI001263DB2C|nr:uncharacterized protein LOC116143950 [Pistacia vera]
MNYNTTSKSSDHFQSMLKESVDRFLYEYRKGVTDFSNFTMIFSRLLQNLPDPSLEYVWFYSALTFYTTKFTAMPSSKHVLAAKDLFQLLVSCSSSCNVVKRVAILGPVIYELYHSVTDKKDSKRDVESLLEGIASYISICCGTESEQDDRMECLNLNSCFLDLVHVWVVDRVGENCEFGDLKVFLPIVGNKVRDGVGVGCRVGYLAGIVMCEAFLLRLCLKFGVTTSRDEWEKDLRDCALQMITGFRSFCFFDILLGMLLEPVLPVTSLLVSEDEVLLHHVLYDVVVTAEYSFLISQRGIQLPCRNLKILAMRWLFVVDNALRSVRENGDQAKVISYINAFSESYLLSQLIKWVTNQIGMGEKTSKPNLSTPVNLIKWLLVVEEQGIGVFDFDITKIYAKTVIFKSTVEYDRPVIMPNDKSLFGSLFLNTDNERRWQDKDDSDLEMVDFVDTEFLADPCMMKSTTDSTRKRKEGRNIEGEIPVKFVKYNFHDNSVSEKFSPLGNEDGVSSGSEVDNPISDEDMEDMKH